MLVQIIKFQNNPLRIYDIFSLRLLIGLSITTLLSPLLKVKKLLFYIFFDPYPLSWKAKNQQY